MEPAHRSTLEDHVNRQAKLGTWVLINARWYYRWRKHYGGMGRDQVKELKPLQKENERLRRAVSDLTLEKLILSEAARGNF